MDVSNFKYKDLTEKIIGAAMQVHSHLGNGFKEIIYQRALAIELDSLQIEYKQEYHIPIYYKEKQIGKGRVDFFIENKVMLEIKAFMQLENTHLRQAKNYLEAFNLQVGLLINFGGTSLEFKRIENFKFKENNTKNLNH
ncbi:GxxExxY protein [Niabella aquatica]